MDTSAGNLNDLGEFFRFVCPPRHPSGDNFHDLFSIFVLDKKSEHFWGTLGRGRWQGRGMPEFSYSEILTQDLARPAPPEGGAANPKGFGPCRRPVIWLLAG